MKIRPGNTKDYKELYEILNSTPELVLESEEETYSKSWVRASLTKKDNFVLIMEDEGKIAGFLIAHILKSAKQLIINDVFVKPAYRHKGVATDLIKEAENIGKRQGLIYSTSLVLTTNKKMQKLKSKLGYSMAGNYYLYYKEMK